MLAGQCICGTVTFEVADEFQYCGYCHCSQCRLAGSGGTAVGGIGREHLTVLSGESALSCFVKSEDSTSFFCSLCGSSVFSDKPNAGVMHVRYGSLTDVPSLRPQAHMYVGSKPDWYEIRDDLPQFEHAPV